MFESTPSSHIETILSRRCIRQYAAKDIPDDVLTLILEAARQARAYQKRLIDVTQEYTNYLPIRENVIRVIFPLIFLGSLFLIGTVIG